MKDTTEEGQATVTSIIDTLNLYKKPEVVNPVNDDEEKDAGEEY